MPRIFPRQGLMGNMLKITLELIIILNRQTFGTFHFSKRIIAIRNHAGSMGPKVHWNTPEMLKIFLSKKIEDALYDSFRSNF